MALTMLPKTASEKGDVEDVAKWATFRQHARPKIRQSALSAGTQTIKPLTPSDPNMSKMHPGQRKGPIKSINLLSY